MLYHDTDSVGAVNSFVLNAGCKGSGSGYRVDTAESLAFVEPFRSGPVPAVARRVSPR